MTRERSSASPAPRAPTFALPELPYPSSALEPHISTRTIEIHHGKHHKAYVDKAADLVKGTAIEGLPLDEAVIESRRLGIGPLFNNIAQIYNHNLFWQSMTPRGGATPKAGPLLEKINASAGSIDAFKAQFVKTGIGQFGSGWIWLVDDGGKLEIINAANAETPRTDLRAQRRVELAAVGDPGWTAHNTSGCPGVYVKRQVIRQGDRTHEFAHRQAQTPQGVKPFRSRSISVDRYGFDGAYGLAVKARAEFVAQVEGYVGVAAIPERFRPAE